MALEISNALTSSTTLYSRRTLVNDPGEGNITGEPQQNYRLPL